MWSAVRCADRNVWRWMWWKMFLWWTQSKLPAAQWKDQLRFERSAPWGGSTVTNLVFTPADYNSVRAYWVYQVSECDSLLLPFFRSAWPAMTTPKRWGFVWTVRSTCVPPVWWHTRGSNSPKITRSPTRKKYQKVHWSHSHTSRSFDRAHSGKSEWMNNKIHIFDGYALPS